MAVELQGYEHSVYSWIARLALREKGVAHDWKEINPFSERVPSGYLALHPFRRVPTLVHGELVLYETGAITRYVDEAFDGPQLQRTATLERARCNQIMSIVDSYAYWPLVRQVFSHLVFRPSLGRPANDEEIKLGLHAAPRVLSALEHIAGGSRYLCGDMVSLADIHLAPMIGYFALANEGRKMILRYARLNAWWEGISQSETFVATMPRLPRTSR
jgi:glutathione S-transferase